VIVVDDGSTDDGAEVVRSFEDPRIRLIQQENRGVSAARNRGMIESSAEFIAFLDADDEWLPGHLETLVLLWKKYPSSGACGDAYLICKSNMKIRSVQYKHIPYNNNEGLIPDYFKTVTFGEPPLCSSSFGVPKKIISEIGFFEIGASWGEDIDFIGRIAIKYPIAFSWSKGAIYHQDVNERLNSDAKIPTNTKIEQPFIKNVSEIRSNAVEIRSNYYLQVYCDKLKLNESIRYLKIGNKKMALRKLNECKNRSLLLNKISCWFWIMVPYDVYLNCRKLKNKLNIPLI
jgi:glycosyltransferase involved in cell wall biosynthesis